MNTMMTTAIPWTPEWVLEHLSSDRNSPGGSLLFMAANDGRFFVAGYAGMGSLQYTQLEGSQKALIKAMLVERIIVNGASVVIPDTNECVPGHALEINSKGQI